MGVLAWDILVGLLLVFPLLSGGVWLRRPGLFLELADLGVPVLVLLGVGGWLFGFRRADWKGSWFLRLFVRIGKRWAEWISRKPLPVLLAGTLFFGSLWAAAALRRHWNFESNSFDLGIFNNAIWNLTHGFGYVSIPRGGINLFADHQSPLFWMLAPLYSLCPRPETLLLIQAFALASGGVAVYFLARQYLRDHPTLAGFAGAIPFLYWAYRPIRNANLFDFHPEVLLLPLFLFAIVGIQSPRRGFRISGVICFLLALGAKESAGPIGAGIALGWFLGAAPAEVRRFTRLASVPLAIVSVAVFIFDVLYVPELLGREYAYGHLYTGGGAFHVGIRLKYLFWTLAPLGFLPPLNWRAAIAALPAYLMLFSLNDEHRINVLFHYGVEPAVGLFWALPLSIALARESLVKKVKSPKLFLVLWISVFALATFGRSEPYRIRREAPDSHRIWVREQVLPCLDPDLGFAAINALVPHLSSRNQITQLPIETGDRGRLASFPCVMDDARLNGWTYQDSERAGTLSRLLDAGYGMIFSCDSVLVLQAPNIGSKGCLSCIPECPDAFRTGI